MSGVTFEFRGEPVSLIASVDDLDLGDAMAMEEMFGFDLRDIRSVPLTRQLQFFVFVSVRRVFPTVALEELAQPGAVRLGPLLAAFRGRQGAPPAPAAVAAAAAAAGQDSPAEAGEVLSPTNAGSEASTSRPASSPARRPVKAPADRKPAARKTTAARKTASRGRQGSAGPAANG